MADVGAAPGGPIGAEDIRDLDGRPRCDHRALRRQLNVLKRAPVEPRNGLNDHGILQSTLTEVQYPQSPKTAQSNRFTAETAPRLHTNYRESGFVL
jgi:hypothetical protein